MTATTTFPAAMVAIHYLATGAMISFPVWTAVRHRLARPTVTFLLVTRATMSSPGPGLDTIVLSEWVSDPNAQSVKVMGYDSAQDQLVMICDMTQISDTEVEITTDPTTPGISQILIRSSKIALIHSNSAGTVDDIVLVDNADAPSLLLPA